METTSKVTTTAKTDRGAGGRAGHGPRTDRAYEYIRTGILRGDLPTGTVLAEATLAASLGISRTPIRQALRLLLEEGLAEVGPRRQLVVRGFSPERRREILLIREALERIAVQQACSTMSIEQVDELRLSVMRQKRAAEAENQEEFIELDEQFHLSIAMAAELPILHKFLSQLRGFVRVMRLGTARHPGHLSHVVAEHEQIVDALEKRDEEGALAALSYHLHTNEYVPDRSE